MKHIVHIYGPCGSGTSTLGREIGRRLGFRFLYTDDFFWLPVLRLHWLLHSGMPQ